MNKVSEAAKRWVGKWFRSGATEQCMNFVRHVLAESGHPLADKVTKEPVDKLWTGPGLANSLAGRDLGAVFVSVDDVREGDILFWEDTYEGPWPAKTITHVGIAIGGGEFVHRPTASRAVEKGRLSGFWLSQFRCGMRPFTVAGVPVRVGVSPVGKKSLKIVAHSGKIRCCVGEMPWFDLDSVEVLGTYT